MSATGRTRYQLATDVRFRKVGGEGVAVCQEAAEVVVVDGIGAEILALLDPRRKAAPEGGVTMAELVSRLAENYDAPSARVARDVEDFVRELVAAGVVEEVAAG